MFVKKRIERHYLEAFQKLAGWSCMFEDWEEPDFLGQTTSEVIGIELTRLFKDEGDKGSLRKRGEEMRLRFLAKVATAYYESGGKPISVAALLQSIPGEDEIETWVSVLHGARPTLPMDVRRVEITAERGPGPVVYVRALPPEPQFDNYKWWQCVSDSVGSVRPLDPEVLNERICEKARRLADYRRSADRVVLVMYADRTWNSGMFEYTSDEPRLDPQGFDEVHLVIYPLLHYRIA